MPHFFPQQRILLRLFLELNPTCNLERSLETYLNIKTTYRVHKIV